MPDKSQDSYFTTFGTYEEMLDYHEEQAKSSIWHRCPVTVYEDVLNASHSRKVKVSVQPI